VVDTYLNNNPVPRLPCEIELKLKRSYRYLRRQALLNYEIKRNLFNRADARDTPPCQGEFCALLHALSSLLFYFTVPYFQPNTIRLYINSFMLHIIHLTSIPQPQHLSSLHRLCQVFPSLRLCQVFCQRHAFGTDSGRSLPVSPLLPMPLASNSLTH